jgi:hypothetical protein
LITGTDNGLVIGRVSPVFTEGRLSLPLVEAPIARNFGLKDGQIIQTTVQVRGEQLGLLLRGRFLDVAPRQDWQVGQPLAFRVEVNANGSLTLHPVPVLAPGAPLAIAAAQQASKPLPSRLDSLFFKPPSAPDTLSLFRPGVMDALLVNIPRPDLQALWRAMQFSKTSITPDIIRQALVGAMGTESSIAKGKAPVATDPKQLMHSLLLALTHDNSGLEMSKISEGQIKNVMDELESAQLHAVQAQTQGEMMFSIVLPFRDAEPVEISFERQPGESGQKDQLTVNVHSQSREYGELWLKTNLLGKTEVDLVMWAVREDVVTQARDLSGLLGLELQKASLVMRSFQVIHGERPFKHPEHAPTGCGHTLDLRA